MTPLLVIDRVSPVVNAPDAKAGVPVEVLETYTPGDIDTVMSDLPAEYPADEAAVSML
jgi:hypothetical protein